jgi:hypothetical protein
MLTLESLNECFNRAIDSNARYIGVRIALGMGKEEVIINPRENFEDKQAYYNQAYDESLRHKYANGMDIRITGFVFGDSFMEIEDGLELYEVTGILH